MLNKYYSYDVINYLQSKNSVFSRKEKKTDFQSNVLKTLVFNVVPDIKVGKFLKLKFKDVLLKHSKTDFIN